MVLANLKNIDLNDIFSKLKSGSLTDKKTLIKFVVYLVAILIFLIGYYFFVSPILKTQQEQINLMNENKIKIGELTNNVGTIKASIEKLEPDFAINSKLFHSKKEVEELYQNISKFALINDLLITNLKKAEPKAVSGSEGQNTEQTTENTSDSEYQEEGILYYTIPVEYEIQGNFLSYLKFRRSLSKSQKVINFDKEEISTIVEIQGQILSKGTISIVGLPNEYK